MERTHFASTLWSYMLASFEYSPAIQSSKLYSSGPSILSTLSTILQGTTGKQNTRSRETQENLVYSASDPNWLTFEDFRFRCTSSSTPFKNSSQTKSERKFIQAAERWSPLLRIRHTESDSNSSETDCNRLTTKSSRLFCRRLSLKNNSSFSTIHKRWQECLSPIWPPITHSRKSSTARKLLSTSSDARIAFLPNRLVLIESISDGRLRW